MGQTQYRQKGNFYLLSTEPYKFEFENVNWNYFEAGHGKGAPDGVGGALKRIADSAYPGIIIEVKEHNILVKCIPRNGINKLFWPGPREDISWYTDQQIIF